MKSEAATLPGVVDWRVRHKKSAKEKKTLGEVASQRGFVEAEHGWMDG